MKSPHETGAIRDWDGSSSRHNTSTEPLPPYRVTCTESRAFEKNTLLCFVTLIVDPPGMTLKGCAVHAKNGKRWVNLPSKQYTGESGVTLWQPLVTIEDKSEYWRFQNLALTALDKYQGRQP